LRRYVSSEHFSVDGTLLEAWASHKSFKPKDDPPTEPPTGRNAEVQWHGEKRSNETHVSTTDSEARLARKSNATAAKLCYSGHLLLEHRNALIVDAELTAATGYAERDTAIEMLGRLPASGRRRTVAGDKGYDTKDFVARTRQIGFTPHVAQNTTRQRSAIDGRTTRHQGHLVSQRIRKRIEEPFGWIKTVAGGRKLRYIGQARNRAWFKITTAVYNLIRITALDAAPT
jgi:Transposase DDE domain